jgi:hypothetical protein
LRWHMWWDIYDGWICYWRRAGRCMINEETEILVFLVW